MFNKKNSGGKDYFKNVKISVLILLLVIVSIAAIVVISVLGIKNMNALKKDTDVLYYDKMTPSVLIEEAESEFLKIRMHITVLLDGYDESVVKKMQDSDQEINRLLSEYEKANLDDEESTIFEELKKSYQNYVNQWYGVKDKMKAGDTITNEEKAIFAKLADIAQSNVELLVEYNLSSAKDMVDNAAIVFNKSVKTFITIVIAVSAIFIIFSFLIIAFIKKNMAQINDYLHKIAEYDFSSKIDGDGSNEFSQMSRSLSKAVENIRSAMGEVREDSEKVTTSAESLAAISEEMASSSQEVSATIEEVAGGASSQAKELSDVVSLIADLTGDIDNINEELKIIRNKADITVEKANLGQKGMDNLIKSVQDIKNVFGLVVQKVSNLNSTVAQIGNITDVITGISDQTNLLALNAAIEAARAGEMGRGFAVVADEVRKLAEDSKRSTDEIARLINSIDMETSEVIKTSDEMEDYVKLQSDAASKAVESFTDILESIEAVTPLIDNTYESMDNTIKAKDKVLEKVETVSAVTEENSAATEEVASSTEELSASSEEVASTAQSLSGMASKLMEVVNLFKI